MPKAETHSTRAKLTAVTKFAQKIRKNMRRKYALNIPQLQRVYVYAGWAQGPASQRSRMRDLQIPGLISDCQFRPPRCPQIKDFIPDYRFRIALSSRIHLMTDADYQCVDIHVCGAMILDRASRNPSKKIAMA